MMIGSWQKQKKKKEDDDNGFIKGVFDISFHFFNFTIIFFIDN